MSDPSEKEVRAALARLVAHGIDAVWHPEAQALLELPVVRERLDEPKGEDAADVLREVLTEAVGQLGQSQYRRLLTIVLGLEPEYARMMAGRKRAIAGREFRGGSNPVGAGTIRQHHEPRALDELAAMLCTGQVGGDGLGGSFPGRAALKGIEWHPTVRRAWTNEQLVFWRLSFGSADPEVAQARLRRVMESAGISSWAMFELLGIYDLLIRAWLPPALPLHRFQDLLVEGLGGDGLLDLGFFTVEKVVTHWPWADVGAAMKEPDPEVLANRMTDREIASLNTGADQVLLDPYEEDRVVAPIVEGGDIGFMIVVALRVGAPVSSSGQREILAKAMADLVDQARQGPFSELSLYQGHGFGSHLLFGRVRPQSFYELERSLVQPLDRIVKFDGSRTYTFIMAAPAALARVEKMPLSSLPEEDPRAEDLLRQEEGAGFEVMSAPALDHPARFAQALARHVVAFLNSDGGTIVIGAVEKGRPLPTPKRTQSLLADTPEVGDYAVIGVNADAEDGLDAYERRLRNQFSNSIAPDPNAHIEIRFDRVGPRSVCILEVRRPERGAGTWYYQLASRGRAHFMVRQGPGTRELIGPEADNYKAQKVD